MLISGRADLDHLSNKRPLPSKLLSLKATDVCFYTNAMSMDCFLPTNDPAVFLQYLAFRGYEAGCLF